MLGVSLNVVWLQVIYFFIYFFSETTIHTRERKKGKVVAATNNYNSH